LISVSDSLHTTGQKASSKRRVIVHFVSATILRDAKKYCLRSISRH
jgi:hypothetical protein